MHVPYAKILLRFMSCLYYYTINVCSTSCIGRRDTCPQYTDVLLMLHYVLLLQLFYHNYSNNFNFIIIIFIIMFMIIFMITIINIITIV